MFRFKKKKEITKNLIEEYNRLLEMWETQWDIMSNDEVRRFLSLDKIVHKEKNK